MTEKRLKWGAIFTQCKKPIDESFAKIWDSLGSCLRVPYFQDSLGSFLRVPYFRKAPIVGLLPTWKAVERHTHTPSSTCTIYFRFTIFRTQVRAEKSCWGQLWWAFLARCFGGPILLVNARTLTILINAGTLAPKGFQIGFTNSLVSFF
jgi:hypothetical protein